MSDQKPEPFTFRSMSFKVSKIKRGFFAPFMAPVNFPTFMGQIVFQWSTYEQHFNDLFVACSKATGTLKDGWERLSYARRRNILSTRSYDLFKANKAIHDHLCSILDDSTQPYLSRNLLVHGFIGVKMETGEAIDGKIPGRISLVIRGVQDGKEVHAEFTEEALENLFYDLAHISGRIVTFTLNVQDLDLPSLDKSFLQEFLGRHYQSSSIPPIPSRPQPSSPE